MIYEIDSPEKLADMAVSFIQDQSDSNEQYSLACALFLVQFLRTIGEPAEVTPLLEKVMERLNRKETVQ